MTIKELIEVLKSFDENMDVTIYVPGDDDGFWELESKEQFKVDETGNTKEKFLRVTIY